MVNQHPEYERLWRFVAQVISDDHWMLVLCWEVVLGSLVNTVKGSWGRVRCCGAYQ